MAADARQVLVLEAVAPVVLVAEAAEQLREGELDALGLALVPGGGAEVVAADAPGDDRLHLLDADDQRARRSGRPRSPPTRRAARSIPTRRPPRGAPSAARRTPDRRRRGRRRGAPAWRRARRRSCRRGRPRSRSARRRSPPGRPRPPRGSWPRCACPPSSSCGRSRSGSRRGCRPVASSCSSLTPWKKRPDVDVRARRTAAGCARRRRRARAAPAGAPPRAARPCGARRSRSTSTPGGAQLKPKPMMRSTSATRSTTSPTRSSAVADVAEDHAAHQLGVGAARPRRRRRTPRVAADVMQRLHLARDLRHLDGACRRARLVAASWKKPPLSGVLSPRQPVARSCALHRTPAARRPRAPRRWCWRRRCRRWPRARPSRRSRWWPAAPSRARCAARRARRCTRRRARRRAARTR